LTDLRFKKNSCRGESGKAVQASGLWSNYFSQAGNLCHSEAMTRTEKLLAELIALPSVNPAFVPQSVVRTARRAVRWEAELSSDARAARPYLHYGEKNVADFLATVTVRAGLEVEFQKVLPGRSNLIMRLLPRNKIRRTILLAPHLDTVNADDSQFVPRRKNGRLYGRGACDTKGSVAVMFSALCKLANTKSRPKETEIVFAGLIDEENAQAGSRALAASGFKANLAIAGRYCAQRQHLVGTRNAWQGGARRNAAVRQKCHSRNGAHRGRA
jgi:acetylornithine deacetylase